MSETGFTVEAQLPFSWEAGQADVGQQRSARLMLRVANLIDSHEAEQDKAGERLEAKLDLMLHWLGQQLFGDAGRLPVTPLTLGGDHIEWDGAVAACCDAVLSLVIHPDLPSPLHLPARIEPAGARCRAQLLFQDEDSADAWNRWLFRLHRRAVQEARAKADQAG